MENLVFLNIVYFLFSVFVIYPPNEVISLGFSIPTIFSTSLGSEQMHFIHYHIMRILITFAIHSFLPIGYYLFMGYFSQLNLFDIPNLSIYWKIYLNVSVLFAIGVCTIIYYWKSNHFSNHPVAAKLAKFSSIQHPSAWKEIANQINAEFRRVEKFSSGSLYNQIYVTDTWLIKVGLYTVHVCRLQNLDLILTHANEFSLTQEGNSGQYLNLKAKSDINAVKPFYIRINSLEYKDLTDKLHRPVIEACQISIKQSLPEQFLDAFRDQISQNAMLQLKREDVDNCIGCMRNISNVKLVKKCDGDCAECYCKPMWCLECLGKWFAYKQDQSEPSTWLSSKCTCATCRAKFCLLDVALVNIID